MNSFLLVLFKFSTTLLIRYQKIIKNPVPIYFQLIYYNRYNEIKN